MNKTTQEIIELLDKASKAIGYTLEFRGAINITADTLTNVETGETTNVIIFTGKD